MLPLGVHIAGGVGVVKGCVQALASRGQLSPTPRETSPGGDKGNFAAEGGRRGGERHRTPAALRVVPRDTRGAMRASATAMTALAVVVFAPACFAGSSSGAAIVLRRPALGAAAAGRIDLAGTAAMHLRGGAGGGLSGDAGAVPGLRKRASKLAKAGDWGGAADVYAEAVELLTGEPSAAGEAAAGEAVAGDAAALQSCLLNRALCCLKAERHEDAVAVCTAALKAEPTCGMAHYRRGQAPANNNNPA